MSVEFLTVCLAALLTPVAIRTVTLTTALKHDHLSKFTINHQPDVRWTYMPKSFMPDVNFCNTYRTFR